MVDGGDDVGVRREKGVSFYLAHGEGDGLGAEGASDLFQGVEGFIGSVLDEVDV